MRNPITVERKKYLNGRANYVAKLGQVEEQAATREEAEQLLLRTIDAMAIKTLAVRALNDGRVAVLQCLGADSEGLRMVLQRYEADGRTSSATLFGAKHWREAEERFEHELLACGQLAA